MTLTAKDVAEIARLLEESTFDELSLELDGLKLTLRRGGSEAPVREGATEPERPAPAAQERPAPVLAAPPTPTDPNAQDRLGREVTAPLLGTFYRAPKPGAPPFVEVGTAVEEATIIGIIEVMKLMNAVRAGLRGTVVAIPAQDGALVEYGEVLMRIREAAEP